jgi:hypothetical protein
MKSRSRAKSRWRNWVRNREPGADNQGKQIQYKKIGHHHRAKHQTSKPSFPLRYVVVAKVQCQVDFNQRPDFWIQGEIKKHFSQIDVCHPRLGIQ